MVTGIADHLAKTKLTTLALFSVTHTDSGKINTSQLGYQRITGPIGKRIITEAHDRKVQVQLTYTVFGYARNRTFFTSRDLQDKTIVSLVALADRIRVDGINVDVERIDADLAAPYADFVGRLREALRARVPKHPPSYLNQGAALLKTGWIFYLFSCRSSLFPELPVRLAPVHLDALSFEAFCLFLPFQCLPHPVQRTLSHLRRAPFSARLYYPHHEFFG
jgi:hypothetical protein